MDAVVCAQDGTSLTSESKRRVEGTGSVRDRGLRAGSLLNHVPVWGDASGAREKGARMSEEGRKRSSMPVLFTSAACSDPCAFAAVSRSWLALISLTGGQSHRGDQSAARDFQTDSAFQIRLWPIAAGGAEGLGTA